MGAAYLELRRGLELDAAVGVAAVIDANLEALLLQRIVAGVAPFFPPTQQHDPGVRAALLGSKVGLLPVLTPCYSPQPQHDMDVGVVRVIYVHSDVRHFTSIYELRLHVALEQLRTLLYNKFLRKRHLNLTRHLGIAASLFRLHPGP